MMINLTAPGVKADLGHMFAIIAYKLKQGFGATLYVTANGVCCCNPLHGMSGNNGLTFVVYAHIYATTVFRD